MKTQKPTARISIEEMFQLFLEEQEARLSRRTFAKYESVIDLFIHFLDNYGWQWVDEDYRSGVRFCEEFGPEQINGYSDFLDYFLVRKVHAGKEFLKTAGTVIRKLVAWMAEKGYLSLEDQENISRVASIASRKLPQARAFSDLLNNYSKRTRDEHWLDYDSGHFEVVQIDPGVLWVRDYTFRSEDLRPVLVSREISNCCELGWVIRMEIGKTRKGWKVIQSGEVYCELL